MLSPRLTHHIQPFVISTFLPQTNSSTVFCSAFFISTSGYLLQLQTFLGFLSTLCEHNFCFIFFFFKFFPHSVNGCCFFWQSSFIIFDSTFIVFSQHTTYIVDDVVVCDFWLCYFNGWRRRFHSNQRKVFMYFFSAHNMTWFCFAHVSKLRK